MSKKSRKRNKKILAALALAGGAAMLGRGKGEISSNRPSGIDAALVASKAKDLASAGTSNVTGRGRLTIDGRGPLEHSNFIKSQAPKIVPPAIRAYSGTGNMRGMNMKGGGIAKRGTGAAYKRGGRVKSMGIAKRGGGAAKR